ncbi:unnamed protein product [Mesocestoides corti]|uniref:Uncharacterized protein n=1 Tax=Mesocestoides corti TaxID=53468 RepID=A0A0R3UN48_MESCO|nr:unnamed protein product [Mesocestoides corti]
MQPSNSSPATMRSLVLLRSTTTGRGALPNPDGVSTKQPDVVSLGSAADVVSTNSSTTSSAQNPVASNLGPLTNSYKVVSTTAEGDITSTSSGTNDPYFSTLSEATAFGGGFQQSSASIYSKLGWSQEQACLADSYVAFLTAVAQHRCWTSSTTDPSGVATTSTENGLSDVGGCEVSGDETVTSSTTETLVIPPRDPSLTSLDTPACEWHQLVIACVLTLIQHDHTVEQCAELDEAPKCCLAAAFLSARVLSASPIAVFRCHAVEFGVFDLITRAWRDASSSTPFNGPVTRAVCLSAIEILVNHHDADVSSCCVKTLMPQVFHWLYELSVTISSSPPRPSVVNDPTDPRLLLHNVFIARLEEAVEAAISVSVNVVDIAEASGRHNLLVILLPLFCDLLQDDVTTKPPGLLRTVHNLALNNLLALGSRYPAEFRHVVAKVTSLKPRIEAALKAQTVSTSASATAAAASSSSVPSSSSASVNPPPAAAIKLKMEFSNFI